MPGPDHAPTDPLSRSRDASDTPYRPQTQPPAAARATTQTAWPMGRDIR